MVLITLSEKIMNKARFQRRMLAETAFFLTPISVATIPRALVITIIHHGQIALLPSRMSSAEMPIGIMRMMYPAADRLAAPEWFPCTARRASLLSASETAACRAGDGPESGLAGGARLARGCALA